MSLQFWIWVAIAAICIIGELLTAGFFLLPFGIGAILAAVLSYFEVARWLQWVVFLGASALGVVLARQFAESVTNDSGVRTGIDRLLEQQGVVVEAIDNAKGSGRVRVQHEEWRAWSDTAEPIAAEAKVTVVRIEGTHLVVRPLEG